MNLKIKSIWQALAFLFLFSIVRGQSPSFQMAACFGTYGWANDSCHLEVDTLGNFYFAGSIDTLFDAAPGNTYVPLTPNGSRSLFVEKLDTAGNLVWVKQIDGSGHMLVQALALGSQGSIWVTGMLNGSMDLDPGPGVFIVSSGGTYGTFALKLSNQGVFQWGGVIGSAWNYPTDIEVGANGIVYIAGLSSDTVDLDPGAATDVHPVPFGDQYGYLVELDAAGNYLQGGLFVAQGGYSNVQDLEVDDDGDIILVGELSSTTDLNPFSGTNLSTSLFGTDVWFVWKIRPSGQLCWYNMVPEVHSLHISSTSDIYYGGGYSGSWDLDPGPGTFPVYCNCLSGTYYNPYAVHLDSAGQFVSAFDIDQQYYTWIDDITTDELGYAYYHGQYYSQLDYDPGSGNPMLISPGMNYYMLKLDPYANFVWSQQFAQATGLYPLNIEVGKNGKIYLGGSANTYDDIDPSNATFYPPCDPPLYQYGGPMVTKWQQDSCSDWIVLLDSVTGLTCSYMVGHAAATPVGGQAPYQFVWGTTPAVTDTFVDFLASGLYGLSVTDNRGCYRHLDIYVNGPNTWGLDVGTYLSSWMNSPFFGGITAIDVYNNGCTPATGEYRIVLDDTVTFLYGTSSPTAIHGDTLIWTYTNLTWDDGHLRDTAYYDIPDSMNFGSFVCMTASVTPTLGDINLQNNQWNAICYPVRLVWDPNDMAVSPSGACDQHYVLQGTKLTYTIRFQNTGTAPALNIAILDTLDSNLAVHSIRLLGSSHPVQTTILPGGVLRFAFAGIMLPDSLSDEPGSHGYVTFEIAPVTNIASGTEIRQHAEIYFDYNPPVRTNDTWVTFVSTIPTCQTTESPIREDGKWVELFPNPTQNQSKLRSKSIIYEVRVFDMQSRLVMITQPNSSEAIVDGARLQAGVYIIVIETVDHDRATIKWIISPR